MEQKAITKERPKAHVSQFKKDLVATLVKLMHDNPIIAVVNLENLPASALQQMRAQLRAKNHLIMTKRKLFTLALKTAGPQKKGIEELDKYLGGMPALIFTKDNPFKLARTLQRSKSPAAAKAGQTAPRDIMVPKGPTSFAPGPIIGELAMVGIKSGVEGGKIAIKEDTVVVKSGEKIQPKVAEILTRLGIQPMEVGLDLVAVYENGTIYDRSVLAVDEKEFMSRLNNAARWAFNLAVEASYPTKSTMPTLIIKAHRDAKNLGTERNILEKGIIESLLGKADAQMKSVKATANVQ